MAKSIMSNKKECFVCGTTVGIHKHHIYGGPNRKLSEKYGCWVYLCGPHHNLSDAGIHFNKELNKAMKEYCQVKFESMYGHDYFMQVFRKNYL